MIQLNFNSVLIIIIKINNIINPNLNIKKLYFIIKIRTIMEVIVSAVLEI